MEHPPHSLESEYLFIERKNPDILSLLESAPVYKKHALIKARPANVGESISTVLADGTIETSDNIAKIGDWVITNPGGEQYIVDATTFLSRNEKTENERVYNAVGYCKAIKNPYNKPIEILASWGKAQYGEANCFIADTCDENGIPAGEPYIIENKAFQDTYKPAED